MLRDALARERNSREQNSKPSAETNQGEQKLDGEEFNMISHEDAEDIEDDEEEGETDSPFHRPGLAGLFGGRIMQRSRNTPREYDHLHPFSQVLSISNVDDCVKLENEVFPVSERCSREKVCRCAPLVQCTRRPCYVQCHSCIPAAFDLDLG